MLLIFVQDATIILGYNPHYITMVDQNVPNAAGKCVRDSNEYPTEAFVWRDLWRSSSE